LEPDTRDLAIDLLIEAVALPNAERQDTVADIPARRLAQSDLKSYNNEILQRNLFAPPD
jgi:hypothetical protein